MKELFHLKKYFYKYRKQLLLGALFILISNIFGIYIPDFVGQAFNEIDEGLSTVNKFDDTTLEIFKSKLLKYGIYVVLFAIAKGFFMFLMRQTVIVSSRNIEFDLKNEIFDHYQKLDQGFYTKNRTGDIINRISEDVSKVRMFLGPAVMYSVNLSIMLVLVISKMISVSPTLTLYSVLPMPILAVTIFFVSNKINIKSLRVQESLASISNISQETFAGIRLIKSRVLEKVLIKRNDEASAIYKQDQLSLIKTQSLFFPLMILLIGLCTLIVIYFGGKEVIAGRMSKGTIAEFIIYINMLTWPVASIGWVSSITYTAAASQKRINEFLKTEPEIKNTASEKHPIDGNIVFNNVSFTYQDSGVEALKNINLTIKPGETLGIIGKTGSGKTTLAQLLCRITDVTDGELSIADRPIQNHHLFHLRNNIAYVPQDVFLFSDTIKNNISFGIENPKEEDIIEATKSARVYENIMRFKNGFESKIGERGISLSGGQKQRISLARAMMKDPKFLILDDCLSAVDTETEHHIIKSLKTWMAGKTSIIISHRVSSLQHADKIIVLENGEITEVGTHDALLLDGKYYASVYKKQQAKESVNK
ncbi:MAG: ABC transporter ATP-binding protein [Flavobacteriales bacterium]